MNEWRWRWSCSRRFLNSTMLTFTSKRYQNNFCIICLRLLIVGIIDHSFDLSSRLLRKVIGIFFNSFWFFTKSCPSIGCVFQILCWCISFIFSPRSRGLSFILLLLCLTSARNNDATTIDWGIIISMNKIFLALWCQFPDWQFCFAEVLIEQHQHQHLQSSIEDSFPYLLLVIQSLAEHR